MLTILGFVFIVAALIGLLVWVTRNDALKRQEKERKRREQ